MAARASVCAFWFGVLLSSSSVVLGDGTAVEDWLDGDIVGREYSFFVFFFVFSLSCLFGWSGLLSVVLGPRSRLKNLSQFMSTRVRIIWMWIIFATFQVKSESK